jgi:hypothetical protein
MKKNLKNVFGALILMSLVLPVSMLFMVGQAKAVNVWGDPFVGSENVGYESFQQVGLGNRDPRAIAANVINIMLGLLGVIAIVLILFGGFKWMTAAGNEDKVGEAKKILGAGIIGLLIVLSAYAVSIYILRSYLLATGANIDVNDPNYRLEGGVNQ